MTDKMTNRKALTYALDNCDLPTAVADKFRAMLDALDRKNGAERKPTAKQVANADIRANLVAFINENAEGDGFTVSELLKECDFLAEGTTNQKVSAILRQAVLANEISKHSVKRRTYFTPYNAEYEVEG